MKVVLIRAGALVTVVVLGWIAIAQAQRGGDDATASDASAAASNPLRTAAPATPPAAAAPPARTTTPVSDAGRRRAADPFGLQAHAGDVSRPAASPPPPARDSIPDATALNAPAVRRVAAEQPVTPVGVVEPASGGPNLISGGAGQSNADRYTTPPDRMARRDIEHRTLPPPAAAESQEPAPFKADPFAMPSNPSTLPKPDRSAFAPPAGDAGPAMDPANDADGSGQPGGKLLEGAQSPQVSIQKFAPKEIQVGKPATFRVTVRNTGPMPAGDVEIRDQVPKGTRLIGTTPNALRNARSELVWTLGTIRPGEETTVEMQVMPTAEGEIGSVATVHFGADASARTIATRPQLVVQTEAPKRVLIGEQMVLSVTLSNPGTGIATGVVLEEHIPPTLQHPAGTELEYEVGDLKPGESRKLELPLMANRPGLATNLLAARADANLRVEDKRDIEVIAPQLDVAMEGPKRRFLEREATYQVSVSNPGTASAKQVELVAYLPPGLKFVNANNAGSYDDSTRTVRWRLEELPASETGSVELVTMPIEAGQQAIKFRGTAQKGLSVEKEQPVVVEGIAAILFQVSSTTNPIEVNGETTYEVHVVNQGSKASSSVRLAVLIPPEMKPIAADGPTRHVLDGNRILFDPLARLAPKADTTYRVRVKGLKAGDLRTRFQLLTDEMQTPVTKEESTRVYADE